MPKTTSKPVDLDSLADLPPELAPAAEAAAAYSASLQSAATAAEAEQADLHARAYALLTNEVGLGKPPRPWAEYLAQAADSNESTANK